MSLYFRNKVYLLTSHCQLPRTQRPITLKRLTQRVCESSQGQVEIRGLIFGFCHSDAIPHLHLLQTGAGRDVTSFKLADPHPSGSWVRNAIRTHPWRQYWMTENFYSWCNRTKAGIQSAHQRSEGSRMDISALARQTPAGPCPDCHIISAVFLGNDQRIYDPLALSLVAPPLRPPLIAPHRPLARYPGGMARAPASGRAPSWAWPKRTRGLTTAG